QLAWLFAATPRVKVILDRRLADEPRHERTRRVRTGTVSPLGDFELVRFTPKTPRIPAYTPGTIVPGHITSGAQPQGDLAGRGGRAGTPLTLRLPYGHGSP